MSKIEKYEDLKCWQQSRVLVNQVYEIIAVSKLKTEFALVDQLKRASISVMTNIAEGFSRYHRKDFIRFLDYAQSSAKEVKSLLYIVVDQKMTSQERVKEIQNNCDHCSAMILALIKHLNKSLNNPNHTSEPKELYLTNEFIIHTSTR
ncbi:MAG: four helix bundle protein [Balneolaceae bacterium]